MHNFSYYLPTRFVFGRGAEEQAGEMTRQAGGTHARRQRPAQRPDWQGAGFPAKGGRALCVAGRRAAQPPGFQGV